MIRRSGSEYFLHEEYQNDGNKRQTNIPKLNIFPPFSPPQSPYFPYPNNYVMTKRDNFVFQVPSPPSPFSPPSPYSVSPVSSAKSQITSPRSFPPQPSHLMMNEPPSRSGILYFGGSCKKNSLLGGSAWWLVDESNAMVGNGADPVHQSFSSLVRLEYEGLLNGLKFAFLKNFRTLRVKGSSSFAINHFTQNHKCPLLNTIYHFVEDLAMAISKLLVQFNYISFELISIQSNKFSHTLAENIIVDYYRRRDMKILRKQTEGYPNTNIQIQNQNQNIQNNNKKENENNQNQNPSVQNGNRKYNDSIDIIDNFVPNKNNYQQFNNSYNETGGSINVSYRINNINNNIYSKSNVSSM